MKMDNRWIWWMLVLVGLSGTSVVAGCGGGDGPNATARVGKQMAATWFSLPAPGASLKEAADLANAGVKPLGVKCGDWVYKDINGEVLGTNVATFVVLVDIQAVDLEAAKGLGFVEADEKYMTHVGQVFDCASRSM